MGKEWSGAEWKKKKIDTSRNYLLFLNWHNWYSAFGKGREREALIYSRDSNDTPETDANYFPFIMSVSCRAGGPNNKKREIPVLILECDRKREKRQKGSVAYTWNVTLINKQINAIVTWHLLRAIKYFILSLYSGLSLAVNGRYNECDWVSDCLFSALCSPWQRLQTVDGNQKSRWSHACLLALI